MIDFSNRFYLKIKLPRKTDKKQIYMQNNYFYYYMQEQHGNVSVFMHFMQILCNPKKTKSRRQLIAAADRFETLESVYRFIVSFVLQITLRFRPR